MVVLGAFTARGPGEGRARSALSPLLIALGVAVARRSGSSSRSGIFEPDARSLVPVGGMVVGNAMAAAGMALNRLGDEMRSSASADRGGAGARRDVDRGGRADGAAVAAVGPDRARSTRRRRPASIAFPGIFVGMLLAGAEPLDAVRLQLVLLYVLLGATAISALLAVTLAQRSFFTARAPAPGAALSLYALNLFDLAANDDYRAYSQAGRSTRSASTAGRWSRSGGSPGAAAGGDTEPRQVMVLVEWPSREAFDAFVADPAHEDLHPLRERGTERYLWWLFDRLDDLRPLFALGRDDLVRVLGRARHRPRPRRRVAASPPTRARLADWLWGVETVTGERPRRAWGCATSRRGDRQRARSSGSARCGSRRRTCAGATSTEAASLARAAARARAARRRRA